MLGDGIRLAVRTLTALPIPPPRRVNRSVAGLAMVIAPVAVIPLGLLVAFVCWAGRGLELEPLAVAAVAIGALAMGSRALHLDGLADTADGLTASYDRERSLTVMKSGNTGPAGVAILIVVLAIQIASIANIVNRPYGPLLAGVLVCVSRAALALTCMKGVPAAREDGLGVTYTQAVPRIIALAVWVAVAAVTTAAYDLAEIPWWHGLVGAGATMLVVAALLLRSVKRFGGVTGDTFGASIELALATLLISATGSMIWFGYAAG
ncbi:MAG: adenosylcobinamide-GDP ribazoletransferase [Aeromicrobium sp.]